jgi:hypothetical protein
LAVAGNEEHGHFRRGAVVHINDTRIACHRCALTDRTAEERLQSNCNIIILQWLSMDRIGKQRERQNRRTDKTARPSMPHIIHASPSDSNQMHAQNPSIQGAGFAPLFPILYTVEIAGYFVIARRIPAR